ncbi:Inorganic pyrophosphatase 3 [Phytophthora cinnamomi]|uniref:Inorganic pyrophosphatase 3 n=1 Tax=Phytophthora cinnamomi TaxID=4785 RepID=UPI00355A571D|nr:Inorganic pyrophosphatase 3 [Phytophthora cinnamomi]
MGDSQNWSSFEPEAPKRPSAASVPKEEEQKTDDKFGKGLSALTEPVAVRNLRNRLMFGSLVGFVTGATFGGIDGAKLYMKQHGKLAPAALSTIARGAATTGGAFSGFFFMYCGIKTALATQREDDLTSAAISTVAAGLPFVRSTVMKQNLPYAAMLVALDHFHEEINEYRK